MSKNNNDSDCLESESQPIPQKPPAVRVPLSGKYLIEASAGTGKTWTLTGIVLRLLIEKRRAPEHIIATTFTRAAAAEMRDRIHARLVDFYQLLQWLTKLQGDKTTHDILYPQLKVEVLNDKAITPEKTFKKITPEQQQTRQQWLDKQAKLSGNAELMADPINNHLINYLLDHAQNYSLNEATRRTALVLTTLDKLFVGTLDSLSQKWLSEYSAETGHQQGVQISDHEQVVIESIIHDTVRAFHSYMYNQLPEIYTLLQHTNRLTKPADHLSIAQKSLQFISTPIQEVDLGDAIDFAAYEQALEDFRQCDLMDIEPYFDKEYRKSQGFHGTASLGAKIDRIHIIQSTIEKNGRLFYVHLDNETQKFYDALPLAFLAKDDGGKGFNANREEPRQTFIKLKSIQALKKVYDYTEQIERYLESLVENLNRDIAIKVRQKLPPILEARRETTFALQMVRLNQALSGKQGEQLARYIRHHYPVALIDESQDINGEQARMIERVYINQESKAADASKETNRGFLLLVGDPKQAIYGFRGGDVANYNAMKAYFNKNNIMSLDINRRSNARLITALNHWFGRSVPTDDPDDGSNSQKADELAQLGKHIYYQHITAANTGASLSWQQPIIEASTTYSMMSTEITALLSDSPVSVIHLPYDKEAIYNDCELTALHIAALLASGQTINNQPLKPSDIGVLGRTKQGLKQVEDMLTKLGVPTLETAETSVFDTAMAADLIVLLEAMLRPHQRDIVNRVLTSHLYRLSLDEVAALMHSVDNDSSELDDSDYLQDRQRYQDFQTYLKTAASYWQHGGILSALHYALGHNPMTLTMDGQTEAQKSHSIWVGLATVKEGARHLMDLRHLLDILAQHGMHIGEYELIAWYKKNMSSKQTPDWARQQPLPTESGVQLMTIHKSKGLEFPVVYVIGMDGASKKANEKSGGSNTHKLYLYDHNASEQDNNNTKSNQKTERRLSASAGKSYSKSAQGESLTEYYAQFETIENYEERRRLAYVAFTRASEQLYLVLGDAYSSTGAERKPSLRWLDGTAKDKAFVLPERLQDQIGWLESSIIQTNAEAVIQAHKTLNRTIKTDIQSEGIVDTMVRINYDDAYLQLKRDYFKGWAKTSFTALSRQLSEQSQALAVFDDGIEDELDLTDSIAQFAVTLDGITQNTDNAAISKIMADDIRFRFVKGANAGTFLHEVFEKIDFDDHSKWSAIIDQGIRQYQLPLNYTSATNQQRQRQDTISDDVEESSQLAVAHHELMTWVKDVLDAPLLASGQSLKAIPAKQRMAELSFNMGLAEDFTPERINDIFTQYLPDEPEKHIQLTAQPSHYIYRYLRGEIDLVYEYAGKYHVVDYKSNYLGNSLSSYNNKNLAVAMDKAGYWLQAAIYQVALHRFLRLRIQNYTGHETKYLGAVEYVFLRGIDSEAADSYGRIQWQIPFKLVQALDTMFGKPSA